MVALTGNSDVSTALEDQPSSRSFFSRFALPIRSRSTRNVVDFHIRPSEPHRKYQAGDHVTGAVVLTVVKPIRLTHLTVALRGFVRVYKNPNGANEPTTFPDVASDGISQFRFLGNGYASLFQDEQVLCADGRLEAGKYEFNFELMFPRDGLPSSIEFERGTIAYNITATLTRPTAISPTTSCDRKVEFVEQIDVGLMQPPRCRTIYLEPISRKAKKKRPPTDLHNPASADPLAEASSDLDSTRVIETSTDGSNAAEDSVVDVPQNPRSPVHSDLRSDVSGDSAVSGSTGLSAARNADPNQPGSLGTFHVGGSKRAVAGDKTIVTTIEMLKGGCLPGDLIPIKVNIQHTKAIRSLHGVIVTFYRQGRVDSAPPASCFKNLSKEEVKRLEKEEYYPKSKTGLGGLSLSSAGSCSVFRKDLSQAFSPLIIDPGTFTANVTTSVRVPENAFPSIRGVPGDMISFRYRMEVVVDLGGKLSNAIQIGQNTRVAAGANVLAAPGREIAAGVTSFDGSLINTDTLKREKGVIYDFFEIVVGTTDSSRRGKATRPAPSIHTTYMHDGMPYSDNGSWQGGWEGEEYGAEDGYLHDYSPYPNEPPSQYPYWDGGPHEPPQPSAPHYIPPPELPDENSLSEKERIRRAEQRLLPSQPDGSPYPQPGHSNGAGPSRASPPTAPPPPPPTNGRPSAPTIADLTANSSFPGANATDDKQELERRRLMAEASAPPECPEDYDAGASGSGSGHRAAAGPSAPPPPQDDVDEAEPSAPMLVEEYGYGPSYAYNNVAGPSAHYAATGGVPAEFLPAYHR